ncbi:hypothetical protein FH972_019201 [Carpinus fangiana]|uniref:Uncharacterized protein n=1 Tax=Carpinus fangiana TaxID=176857 RepID=A0A5N6RPV6_9ROSI|nr:hypothetical protein FH972_019201 [Carpinus fangiana]
MVVTSKESESKINHMVAAGDFNGNVPDLQVFILADIEAATDRLSFENKLGERGYGPVYKLIKRLRNMDKTFGLDDNGCTELRHSLESLRLSVFAHRKRKLGKHSRAPE